MSNVAPEQYRPPITVRTPLGQVPREWLEIIEPRLYRPRRGRCWCWMGQVDGKNGCGRLKVEGVNHYAHRIAACMFWKVTASIAVVQTCGNRLCCNPAHFKFERMGRKPSDLIKHGNKILLALADGLKSQNAIAVRCGISQPRVSQIITLLRKASLIEARKSGLPATLTPEGKARALEIKSNEVET